MLKEVPTRECRVHEGKKKLCQCMLQMGYYWPTMKRDVVEFVEKCHNYHVQANLIYTHPQILHSMVTLWPFHTWGLDLVGPINPHLHGYISILMAKEYFTKWAETIPHRKAMGGVMANFIKENIIFWSGCLIELKVTMVLNLSTERLERCWSFTRSSTISHRLITPKWMGRRKQQTKPLSRLLAR